MDKPKAMTGGKTRVPWCISYIEKVTGSAGTSPVGETVEQVTEYRVMSQVMEPG